MSKKNKRTFRVGILLKLFVSSLYVSAVAFGGGFVSLSLIKNVYVDKFKWINQEEMTDINAVSQASPGSIALNSSMLIGLKKAGFLGLAVTLIASLLPPVIVITALYYFYDAIKELSIVAVIMKGMQAGVAAVIMSLVVDMVKQTFLSKSAFAIALLFLTFSLSTGAQFFFDFSIVIYLIILSAVLGVSYSYITFFKAKKREAKRKSDIS